jgi:hypothetical protein
LAWGKPDQIVQSENGGALIVTWLYMGTWMEETRYWAYHEHSRDHGSYLERSYDRDFTPRTYISAELNFENGVLKSWRTLPQPGN